VTAEAQNDVPGALGGAAEATSHGHLDPMIREWPIIASIAWEGFMASGRGHVVVEVDGDEVGYRYQAGAPCSCHAVAVEEYDPEAEVVVAVSIGESLDVYRLGAVPSPFVVWATTPGSAYGATEQ